jgi:hypothetical protein
MAVRAAGSWKSCGCCCGRQWAARAHRAGPYHTISPREPVPALPTSPIAVASLATLALLYVQWVRHLPRRLLLEPIDARAALTNPLGAVFGMANLLACLALLAAAPTLGWPM